MMLETPARPRISCCLSSADLIITAYTYSPWRAWNMRRAAMRQQSPCGCNPVSLSARFMGKSRVVPSCDSLIKMGKLLARAEASSTPPLSTRLARTTVNSCFNFSSTVSRNETCAIWSRACNSKGQQKVNHAHLSLRNRILANSWCRRIYLSRL